MLSRSGPVLPRTLHPAPIEQYRSLPYLEQSAVFSRLWLFLMCSLRLLHHPGLNIALGWT